jgi:hypothetical protein
MRDHIDAWVNLDGPVFISLRISGPGAVVVPQGFRQPPPLAQQIENMRSELGVPADR